MPSHYLLAETGAFVAVYVGASHIPTRRGAVLASDDQGITIRSIAAAAGQPLRALIEYWPWANVIYISEADPRPDERKLLGRITPQ